jgi:hypothetical protein
MVYQAYSLIIDRPVNAYFAAFVFFSTVCSYNFHWALTPGTIAPSQRLQWDEKHKSYHLLLSIAGLAGAAICFFFIKEHWFYIGIAAILTFLYSAPKISFPPFQWLKKIAIGKTIFLAMTWTYVTAVLQFNRRKYRNRKSDLILRRAILFYLCDLHFYLIFVTGI